MKGGFFIFVVLFISSVIGQIEPPITTNSRTFHTCQLTQQQNAFSVLPGYGWDNLENVGRGQVLNISYSSCRTSPDGVHLIPDYIEFHPNRASLVRLDSELFDHYSNFTSTTARSLNVDANYATPKYQISGSFSWEHKSIKEKQIRDKSTISRVQLRYNMFSLRFQPDAELNPQFRNRIIDIGAALMKEEEDRLYPKYLAQLLVRDFGTHIVRSVDAGALLQKVDLLKEKYMRDGKHDSTDIRTTASFSMRMQMNIKIGYTDTSTTDQVNEYNKNCASTTVETVGGKQFGSDFQLKDWEQDFVNNLVAVDRRGEPLNYVITPRSVPELGVKTIHEIGKLISEAIDAYYAANTRLGCMDMRSPNFNDDANVDNGQCEPPKVLYSLGGAFQTCYGDGPLCSEITQINPGTGGFSCPSNYNPVLLHEAQWRCRTHCSFWVFGCHLYCAHFRTYWCSPTKAFDARDQSKGGYLFGGYYTKSYNNPVTNAYTCPPFFIPIKFGSEATICLSSDSTKGLKNSLVFGGFFSCTRGNPMSDITVKQPEYWAMGCSPGYSEHLLTLDRGCQLTYCVKSNELSSKVDPPLLKPPFIDLSYGPNISTLTSFTSMEGISFKLHNDGLWKQSSTIAETVKNSIDGKIVGYSILGSVIIATLILVAFFGINRVKNRYKRSRSNVEKLESNEGSSNQAYHGLDEVQRTKSTTTILLPPNKHSNSNV